MKLIITIFLFTQLILSQSIFDDEGKFQQKLMDSMIYGTTETLKGTARLLTNTPTPKKTPTSKKASCSKKWWNLYNESGKLWWKLHNENVKIKTALRKRKINYSVILRQEIKEPTIDLVALKKTSCSKNYFNLALKRKKSGYKIKMENKILKRLARQNYIEIPKEESTYQSIKITEETDEEHLKAKEALLKAMREVD